jgi:hypothetical protein
MSQSGVINAVGVDLGPDGRIEALFKDIDGNEGIQAVGVDRNHDGTRDACVAESPSKRA